LNASPPPLSSFPHLGTAKASLRDSATLIWTRKSARAVQGSRHICLAALARMLMYERPKRSLFHAHLNPQRLEHVRSTPVAFSAETRLATVLILLVQGIWKRQLRERRTPTRRRNGHRWCFDDVTFTCLRMAQLLIESSISCCN
jgi:hypothetical protein